jgi:hypothetical protein
MDTNGHQRDGCPSSSVPEIEEPSGPRRSLRPRCVLPNTIKSIFHDPSYQIKDTSSVKVLHMDPLVILVEDFLSPNELGHIDAVITRNINNFEGSFTEDGDGKRHYSKDRTSKFLSLQKSHDKTFISIEEKVANFVGIHSARVEPIQVVSYSEGQHFDLHHDAGTIHDTDPRSQKVAVELCTPLR